MKHFVNTMMLALALLLALLVGVVAVAEPVAPETPDAPAIEEAMDDEAQPEQPGVAADDANAPDTEATDEQSTSDAALRDALDAYRAAKTSARQQALEDELNGYVESGSLTREQADLILNYYKEQQALRDGTCPNCGTQLPQNGGMGGRMKGGRGMNGGMNGGMGGRMKGGRGMDNRQQNGDQQPADGQSNGTAYFPGAQTQPNVNGYEGI